MKSQLVFLSVALAVIFGLNCQKKPIACTGLVLTPSSPPFAIGTADFYKNRCYDNFADTKFDIFLPDVATPTALVIYIHGGGFSNGDKEDIYQKTYWQDQIKTLLNQNIAFASINYRKLPAGSMGVKRCIFDGRRCLQFIRYHATDLNIDKNRIGLYGSSAGAGTALWLAFSDEMADAGNPDMVLRESTRVKAVAAYATQCTYDLERWPTDVFSNYMMDMTEVTGIIGNAKITSFYGMPYNTSTTQPYRDEVDMLDLITPDDPPLWVENPNTSNVEPMNTKNLFHHYRHAELLYDSADGVLSEVFGKWQATNFESLNWIGAVDFFIQKL